MIAPRVFIRDVTKEINRLLVTQTASERNPPEIVSMPEIIKH